MIKDLYTGVFELAVSAEKMLSFRPMANSTWNPIPNARTNTAR